MENIYWYSAGFDMSYEDFGVISRDAWKDEDKKDLHFEGFKKKVEDKSCIGNENKNNFLNVFLKQIVLDNHKCKPYILFR